MAESSRFWTTSGTGDGASGGFTAAQFQEFMRHTLMTDALSEGVLKGIGNELSVTGASTSVNVASGSALVYGVFYANDAPINVPISTNTGGGTRIDRIVLRANLSPTTGTLPQTVRVAKIEGTPGGAAPGLTQSSTGTFEIPLANVSITTGNVITVSDQRTFVKTPGAYGYLDDANIIGSTQLASDSVTTAKILDGNVTANKLASSAATEAKIATGAVTEAKIGAGAVTSGKIGAGAVVSGKIAADAVTTAAILNGTVTADKLVSSAVTTDKIATGAVTSAKIATGTVTGGTSGGAATGNIAVNTIVGGTSGNIAFATITSANISTNAITGGVSGNIGLTTITADNIADNAVTEGKIITGAVTVNKIGGGAVTSAKLGSGAVTTSALAANAVTSTALATGSVTNDKIVSMAWSKLTNLGAYLEPTSRQGGSSTAWATSGTTNYGLGNTQPVVQLGSATLSFSSTSTATATITLSSAYSGLPIVYVSADTSSLDSMITVATRSIGVSQFTIKAYATTNVTGSLYVYWLAIGTTS